MTALFCLNVPNGVVQLRFASEHGCFPFESPTLAMPGIGHRLVLFEHA